MGEHYCIAVFSSNALSPATCHCTNIKPLIFVTRMCGQGQLSVLYSPSSMIAELISLIQVIQPKLIGWGRKSDMKSGCMHFYFSA